MFFWSITCKETWAYIGVTKRLVQNHESLYAVASSSMKPKKNRRTQEEKRNTKWKPTRIFYEKNEMPEREKRIKAKGGRKLRTWTSIARFLEKILGFCHVKQLKANCFTPCDAPKKQVDEATSCSHGRDETYFQHAPVNIDKSRTLWAWKPIIICIWIPMLK
jgi:hypothetical protein